MGTIRSTKTLFFVTSPRSPEKLIPEIKFLVDNFAGMKWRGAADTQAKFINLLREQEFFEDTGKELKYPDFAARERVGRSPQGLGFVNLEPVIELTAAGEDFIYSKRPEEILIRQMMKFQVPSVYHKPAKNLDCDFWCKPYLELLRLIRHFGSITFDEMKIFGLQLTNYSKFDEVVDLIEDFRREKALSTESYKAFSGKVFDAETRKIYKTEIDEKRFSVRESPEKSEKNLVNTKKRNAHDYTDAVFRCFAMTGLTTVSQSGHSISIAEEKIEDVEYLLRTVPRDPEFVYDKEAYKKNLFDAASPALLTDNEDVLKGKITNISPSSEVAELTISQLKDLYEDLILSRKSRLVDEKIRNIKEKQEYADIIDVFKRIENSDFYDNSLMFEWNAWRAMTMIDGGNIIANLNFDDNGKPLSTAAGNKPDIMCDYGDFVLNVEVTLQKGQKQYDNEGEPVARHLGRMKENCGKETFCLFVAPKVSKATIAYFYALQAISIDHYGGKAIIIPLNLSSFIKMVQDSYKAAYTPSPQHVFGMINRFIEARTNSANEIEWFDDVQKIATEWLSAA